MRNFTQYVENRFPDIRLKPKVHFDKFQNLSGKNTIQQPYLVRTKLQSESSKETRISGNQNPTTSTCMHNEISKQKTDKQYPSIVSTRKSNKKTQKHNS